MKKRSSSRKITSFMLVAALLFSQMAMYAFAEEADGSAGEGTQIEETAPPNSSDTDEPGEAPGDEDAEVPEGEDSEDLPDEDAQEEEIGIMPMSTNIIVGFKLSNPAVQYVGSLSYMPGATLQINGTLDGEAFTANDYFADQSNSGYYGVDYDTTGNTFVINYHRYSSSNSNNGIGKITGSFDVDSGGNVVNLSAKDITNNNVTVSVSGTAPHILSITNPIAAANMENTTRTTFYQITHNPSNAAYVLTDSRDGSILPPIWAAVNTIQYSLPVPNTLNATNTINYTVSRSGFDTATGNFAIERITTGASVGHFTTTFHPDGNEESYIYPVSTNPNVAAIVLKSVPTDYDISFYVRSSDNAAVTMTWDSDGTVIPQSSSVRYEITLVLTDTLVNYTVSADKFRTVTGQLMLKPDGSVEDLTDQAAKDKTVSYTFDAPTQSMTIEMLPSVVLAPVAPGLYEADFTGLLEYMHRFSDRLNAVLLTGAKVTGGMAEIVNPEAQYKMVIVDVAVEGNAALGRAVRRVATPITQYFTGISPGDETDPDFTYLNDIVALANQNVPGHNFQSYYDCILYYMQNVGGYPEITSLDELGLEGLLQIFPSKPTGGGDVTLIVEPEDEINALAEKLLREYSLYFTLDYGMTGSPISVDQGIGVINPMYDGLQYMDYVNRTEANKAQTDAILDGIVIDENGSYTFDDIAFSSIGSYLHNPFYENFVNFDFKLYFRTSFVGIDGIVFEDADKNGVYDDREPVFADVPVRLYKADDMDTPIATTTTDSDGYYIFAEYNLMTNGDYVVQIDVPSGYVITSPGTSRTNADNVFTLNADKSTADSQTISYTVDTSERANAGLIKALYTVTYDPNGGIGGHQDTEIAGGSSYTVRTNREAEVSRDGYTFNGWNTEADGGGTVYSPESEIVINGNLLLYAQWTKNTGGGGGITYTVTYNANGGTGSHRDTGIAGGSRYTVRDTAATGISRSGYTFTGWNTKADGSGTAYYPSDKFTVNSNMTLYAQWAKEEEPPPDPGTDPGTDPGDDRETISKDRIDEFNIPEEEIPYGYLDIENHFAYIIGYPDGNVRPQNGITREEVATIFFRLLTSEARIENWATINSFSDVSADRWSNNAISTLASIGIIKGYDDGTFRPEEYITRAELAAIAARFDKEATTDIKRFTDISGHWAENYIIRAALKGWVKGYEDGTFRPDQNITRAEVMTLVNRVLDRHVESEEDMLDDMVKWPDNPESEWYYLDVQEATNSHYYDIKADSMYEEWTQMRDAPNWAALEKHDSTPDMVGNLLI